MAVRQQPGIGRPDGGSLVASPPESAPAVLAAPDDRLCGGLAFEKGL